MRFPSTWHAGLRTMRTDFVTIPRREGNLGDRTTQVSVGDREETKGEEIRGYATYGEHGGRMVLAGNSLKNGTVSPHSKPIIRDIVIVTTGDVESLLTYVRWAEMGREPNAPLSATWLVKGSNGNKWHLSRSQRNVIHVDFFYRGHCMREMDEESRPGETIHQRGENVCSVPVLSSVSGLVGK